MTKVGGKPGVDGLCPPTDGWLARCLDVDLDSNSLETDSLEYDDYLTEYN